MADETVFYALPEPTIGCTSNNLLDCWIFYDVYSMFWSLMQWSKAQREQMGLHLVDMLLITEIITRYIKQSPSGLNMPLCYSLTVKPAL